MKALITGIAGFAGSHLLDHLLANNVEVGGIIYHASHGKALGSNLGKIEIFAGDLSDPKFVSRVVRTFKPDQVYHLAAQSSAAVSLIDPDATLTGNLRSQLNILEAVRHNNLDSKILIVGSAEEYGLVTKKDLPITENAPLRPIQPYAVSKIAQDFLGLQYFLAYGLNIIRVRPFNHIGPRQRTDFVVADFCNQVAAIVNNKQEPVVKAGKLEVKRDFTDVRDMVKAYHLALDKGVDGDVYNLGFGKSYQIGWILDQIISLSGKKIKVEVESKRLRPVDIPETVCDSSKFTSVTGWKPQIPIEKTLKDTLDYYINLNR